MTKQQVIEKIQTGNITKYVKFAAIQHFGSYDAAVKQSIEEI
jgi:hypothetical protein